ncbi:MAG: PKD domain-containing protein [Syntrophobacteraceae bacterium]
MKRFAGLFLLAVIVGALCAPAVHASPSRGANCLQCHSFPNQPPVANAGVDQTVNAGATVSLNGSSSRDSDDGIASYAWTQTAGSSVTLANAGTRTATFTAPNVSTQTVLTFRLTVTDRLPQSSTDTCTVTVRPVTPTNQPPVANAGADQTVTAGASVTLSGGGSSDPDDGIGSYVWTQTNGTSVTLANAGTQTAAFTAPNVTASTVLTFQLTVRDRGNQAATDACTVTVRPAGSSNQAPVANAGADQTVTAGSSVTLNGSGSTDPDDGIASYAWTQTGTPAVTLTNATAANATFSAPQVSSATVLTFQVRVTDRSGASSSDTCTVRVNPPTTPPAGGAPIANAGLDLIVLPGTINNLDGFYSSDPDGDIVSYAWEQTGGPEVTLSDATAMSPIFQAPTTPSTLAFRLLVTDRSGRQGSDACTVTVTSAESAPPPASVNQLPVANAGADQSVQPRVTVRLSGSGSRDADDGIASYQWQQTSGPSVRLYGATTASARFTSPRVNSRTTFVFRLTVKDRAGQSATDSVTITVGSSGGDDDEEDDD